ncbi:MFS transporter [Prauserella sp. ASG 168]|uniref:MFS transporter n=2 Tax=Prauserella cavernicola TaxID=2800127 RepID=A0A934QY27_9PSEU|nr:MFS transporter [Prauserella cavernicola]
MWGLGALCYLTALFHRMSLSVAGLTAQQRFDIDATGLAAFSVVQLGLYAALQVPVGVGSDRLGPRKLLLAGMALLAGGTVVFALASAYPMAMAGRALIGAGDACMFVSVLRIAHNWFPGRRYALVSALTGMIGGLGQLIATAPLSALLAARGWTPTFLIAAVITVVLLVVTGFALRESPAPVHHERTEREPLRESLRHVWRTRGTRHALWCHFTLMGTFVSFSAVLGQPYLVGAHGLSESTASTLLGVLVIGFVLVSTASGQLASRRPGVRGPLVLGAALVAIGCSALLVALPERVSAAVLAVVLFLVGACGGVSMLAFDLARSSNHGHRSGLATGVANMGGFTFAVIAQFGVGIVLDALVGAGVSASTAHRLSFAVPLVLALGGLSRVVLLHRHAGVLPPATGSARKGRRAPGTLAGA